MTFNHKLVDEFLKAIFPLPQKFGVIYSEDEELKPINFSSFQEAILSVDHDAHINFGVSKMVIISPNLNNIVIKIPFNGYYMENALDGDLEWNPFCWATGADPKDYCLAEFEKYKKLKTYGLDCFVAKTMFYKKFHGIRIFLQEQIIPENNSYYTCKPSKNSQDLANRWYDENKFDIDPEWVANCLDKYGKSKVERFLSYCDNIDLDILDDMHDGNYGYRNNNTPCLLDFSNFNN